MKLVREERLGEGGHRHTLADTHPHTQTHTDTQTYTGRHTDTTDTHRHT